MPGGRHVSLPSLGFVGLGNMGGPMASRLADAWQGAGFAVFDLDRKAATGIAGAQACDSAKSVGDLAEIVFCCLPSPEASWAVANELASSARCRVLVETSTVGRATIARLQALGRGRFQVLDCPVSGGRAGAVSGQLTAIISGPGDLVQEVRPILDIISSKLFVVGEEAGMAQVCKIANNALSISAFVVTSEAVVMGVKAGLDPQLLIDVFNASSGRNSATTDKFPRAILPRTFDLGGPMTIGVKDLNLFLEEAKALGSPAFSVSNAAQVWGVALQRFGAQADGSLIYKMVEELAGLR
jgi:3-hydroxyisobutyrate dehydrogenase-like beta-hydroxyacid dehydrogenase